METDWTKLIRQELNNHDMLLLAHNYQVMAIQESADFVGDSLELSKIAKESEHEKIMFSAVYFMAETAAILSPSKKIFIAQKEAGCPLADSIKVEDLLKLKQDHPGVPVMCYINSNAEIKALSDVVCTSANAVRIAEKIKSDELIFVPDQGLGSWVAEKTGKKVHLHKGFCNVHWHMPISDITESRKTHPDALLVVHPECTPEVRRLADFVVGTSGMIKYAQDNPGREFIIGTEVGMKQRLEKMFPQSKFFMASKALICPNMKKTYPELLANSIRNEETLVAVDRITADRAKRAIERMHEF